MSRTLVATEKELSETFTQWAKDVEENPDKFSPLSGTADYGDACASELIERIEKARKK